MLLKCVIRNYIQSLFLIWFADSLFEDLIYIVFYYYLLFLGLYNIYLLKVIKRVKEIAAFEELPYTEDGLSALTFTSEGDMRQVFTVDY